MRAGWLKTTAGSGPREQRERGRHDNLIATDENANEKHQSDRIEARRAKLNHSLSISLVSANVAGRRAISTIQKPSFNRGRVSRTISRSRLRARLRMTALPMRREVINPTRMPGSEVLSTLNTMNFPDHELPPFLTFPNSEALARRAAFGKRKVPRFGLESTRQRAVNHDFAGGQT